MVSRNVGFVPKARRALRYPARLRVVAERKAAWRVDIKDCERAGDRHRAARGYLQLRDVGFAEGDDTPRRPVDNGIGAVADHRKV